MMSVLSPFLMGCDIEGKDDCFGIREVNTQNAGDEQEKHRHNM